LSQAARKNAAANSHTAAAPVPTPSRGPKDAAFLVTQDESLWPQIGQSLDREWSLKQVDTIDELQRTTHTGQAGIVLWDAREQEDRVGGLSRLQLHSMRFAIIVLDSGANAETWRPATQQRQIVAHLDVPFDAAQLLEAFNSARDECHARSAVLGDAAPPLLSGPVPGSSGRRIPQRGILIAAAVCASLGGFLYLWHRQSAAPPVPVPAPTAAAQSPGAAPAAPAAPVETAGSAETAAPADEKVDTLLEQARQAVLDRHFIEPAEGNALALYQNVLIIDPNNGEARQGLQRIGEILFARVQSNLDERKFDLALQALETARSLIPDDARLTALDARIESVRAELGPAQIQAALNAKNYDRALQLLDEAARAKSLGAAKLAQLRDEVHKRQAEADVTRILKFLGTRIQQDRLLEPRNDSAAYYLQQARLAGAAAADLQESVDAYNKKLTQAARSALDQHRVSDAERFTAEARNSNAAPQVLAGLQHDIDVARENLARDKALHAQILELAQNRLTHGEVVEPENDSALFYVNQLRSADPTNSALPQITGSLQTAIVARARSALDAGDLAKADTLVKQASGLGNSAELDALSEVILQRQLKQGKAAATSIQANSLVAVKPLQLEYPQEALVKGTEGWVDLAFTVTAEGKVTNVTVVNSSPRGVFDSEAKRALSRVRYKPVLTEGKASAFTATLRVAFRLDKK
jgi:TonB family protein